MSASTEPGRAELLRAAGLTGALALLAALAFYGLDVASGRAVFFTHDLEFSDVWHLNYPLKYFYAAELRAGRLPFWAPEIGSGFPLFAEGQVGALYPPNLLLFGLLPLPLAFGWATLVHAVAAAAFTALFARQLGAGLGGSAVAGLVFAFSGFLVVHVKHLNLFAAAVWIPLLLFWIERFARGGSRLLLAGLAATVATMILAGHPQIAYGHLLVAAGWALYRIGVRWRGAPEAGGGRGPALRLGAALLTATAAGLLLAAPQTLPTWELHRLGPRHGGLSLAEASQWEYRPEHLWAFVRPMAFGDPGRFERRELAPEAGEGARFALRGYNTDASGTFFWEMTAYVGLLPLALALAAGVLGWREASVRALLALLLLSLLLALGRHGGLYLLLFHWLPGFDVFRFASRYLLYADLALALLAGIGLSRIGDRLAAAAPARAALAGVALVVCYADLAWTFGDHNPTIAPERWSAPPPLARRIAAEESGRDEPFRIADIDPLRLPFVTAYYRALGWKGDLAPYDAVRNALNPNLNVLYGLANLNLYFKLLPRWTWEISELLLAPPDAASGRGWALRARVADSYNVRYLIDTLGVLGEEFPRLASVSGGEGLAFVGYRELPGARELVVRRAPSPAISLHRNPRARARAWWVPRARAVGPRGIEAFLAQEFDPGREVLLMEPAAGLPPALAGEAGPAPGARVRIERYGPQRVELSVQAPHDGWVFLADTHYPGWSARVDGRPLPIHRANVAGRAVRVPAGSHALVFRYVPASFRLGLVAAGAGALLLAALPRQRWLAAPASAGTLPPRIGSRVPIV